MQSFGGILEVDGYAGYNRRIAADRIGPGTLTAIVKGHKQSQIDGLLPWNHAATV